MSEVNSGVVMLGVPEPERDASNCDAYAGFLQAKSRWRQFHAALTIYLCIYLNRSILEQSLKLQGLSLEEYLNILYASGITKSRV